MWYQELCHDNDLALGRLTSPFFVICIPMILMKIPFWTLLFWLKKAFLLVTSWVTSQNRWNHYCCILLLITLLLLFELTTSMESSCFAGRRSRCEVHWWSCVRRRQNRTVPVEMWRFPKIGVPWNHPCEQDCPIAIQLLGYLHFRNPPRIQQVDLLDLPSKMWIDVSMLCFVLLEQLAGQCF